MDSASFLLLWYHRLSNPASMAVDVGLLLTRTNITELKVPKGPTYYLLYCVRRIRQNVTITFKVQTKKSNSRNFRLGSSENFLFSGGQLSACHDYLAVNDILRWSWWSDLLSLLWDCLLRNQPPACCCLSTTGWIVVVIITSWLITILIVIC